MKIKFILTAVVIATTSTIFGQEEQVPDSISGKTFELGEITVIQHRRRVDYEEVSIELMQQQQRNTVTKALIVLPGINSTSSGARNESTVSIRGFDLRGVPVYMDGIPVYVPYDGYVDLGRFTTFDLGKIKVSKGFSSLLYGPNALGGTINLISRKPTKIFEFDGSLGMINTNGYSGNINLGSAYKNFYFQGGYSYFHRDAIVLPKGFKGHPLEGDKYRENSYNTDQKISVKIGWTPTENQEYAIGYINQMGNKGNPIYVGEDTLNQFYTRPRFWQWPKWNKETYYFISNSAINNKNYIKTRVYFDRFKNITKSFDDNTYTTQVKPSSFESIYNDYTIGGNIEYGTKLIPLNELKMSLYLKQDVHREHDVGDPVQKFNDLTSYITIEDIIRLKNRWLLVPGVSYSFRHNILAEQYDSNTETISSFSRVPFSHAFNFQIGGFYVTEGQKLSLAASRKTRFATIKDRYSYRLGKAIPNPSLKPEHSNNFDVTYANSMINGLAVEISAFTSYINDIIQYIDNVWEGKSQMQNKGQALFAGGEIATNYSPVKVLNVGVNYSYLYRKNITNPMVYLTDVPNHKLYGYVQYQPVSQIDILVSSTYNSYRYSTSYGTKAPGFALLNASVSYKFWKYMAIELGMNNILDANYALTEGYPEEGRNFYVTLRFFNNK